MAEGRSSSAIARDLFDDLAAPDWLLSAVRRSEAMPMLAADARTRRLGVHV